MIEHEEERVRSLAPHPTLVAHPATAPVSKECEPRKPTGNISKVSFGLENYRKGKVVRKSDDITKDNEYYKTAKEMMQYHGWHGKDIRFEKKSVKYCCDILSKETLSTQTT